MLHLYAISRCGNVSWNFHDPFSENPSAHILPTLPQYRSTLTRSFCAIPTPVSQSVPFHPAPVWFHFQLIPPLLSSFFSAPSSYVPNPPTRSHSAVTLYIVVPFGCMDRATFCCWYTYSTHAAAATAVAESDSSGFVMCKLQHNDRRRWHCAADADGIGTGRLGKR